MKPILRRLSVFLCLFCFVVVSGSAFSADSPKEEMIAKIKAYRADLMQNASFCCSFTFKAKKFSSEEEEASAEIGDDDILFSWEGRLFKKGEQYRYQIRELGSPHRTDFPLLYIDKAANKNFSVEIVRFAGDEKTKVPLTSSLSLVKGEPFGALSRNNKFWNPLYLIDEIFKNPYGFKDADLSIEYSDIDGQHGKLTLTGEGELFGKKYPWVREITVRTDLPEPEIEQIVVLQHGSTEVKRTYKIVEWKDSDGRKIPAYVRGTTYSVIPTLKGSESWHTEEWKSEGIGERMPEDKDFVIELKPEDKIKNLSPSYGKREINVNALTEADYVPEPKDE